MTGTLKIFAALARPMTLLKRSCRSIDATPKVICGWWSMKMTVQFAGVSRLWIWLLSGMVLSFRNGPWNRWRHSTKRAWGQLLRGLAGLSSRQSHAALPHGATALPGGGSWMTLASLNRRGPGRVAPPLLHGLARTAVHRGKIGQARSTRGPPRWRDIRGRVRTRV